MIYIRSLAGSDANTTLWFFCFMLTHFFYMHAWPVGDGLQAELDTAVSKMCIDITANFKSQRFTIFTLTATLAMTCIIFWVSTPWQNPMVPQILAGSWKKKKKKKKQNEDKMSLVRPGVLNYFFLRATKGRRQFKDRCLRAKWSPLSCVFLCIMTLTKGQTSMVWGPDLAHGPPVEKAWVRQ